MLYFDVALGLFYAVLFIYVAIRWPIAALSLILALAPLQTNIGAGIVNFSLTEINLIFMIPVLISMVSKKLIHPSLGTLRFPIAIYLFVCVISSMTHWRGNTALVSIAQMLLYMILTPILFASLVPMQQLRTPLTALAISGSIWAILGIATSFTFLGHNKNAFGASLSVAFLVSFNLWLTETQAKKRTWFSITCFIILSGLILSISRGAWLGTISGIVLIVMLRGFSTRLWTAIGVGIALVLMCWSLLPPQSREYALGFGGDRVNIQVRFRSLSIAQQNFAQEPFLGMGVGLRKEYDATNLLWSVLAETGVLGLVTFAAIFVVFFYLVWRTRRLIPANDPILNILATGGAVMFCKMMHGMVDHYWSRGAVTIAWAGAGMVLGTAQLLQKRGLAHHAATPAISVEGSGSRRATSDSGSSLSRRRAILGGKALPARRPSTLSHRGRVQTRQQLESLPVDALPKPRARRFSFRIRPQR